MTRTARKWCKESPESVKRKNAPVRHRQPGEMRLFYADIDTREVLISEVLIIAVGTNFINRGIKLLLVAHPLCAA